MTLQIIEIGCLFRIDGKCLCLYGDPKEKGGNGSCLARSLTKAYKCFEGVKRGVKATDYYDDHHPDNPQFKDLGIDE